MSAPERRLPDAYRLGGAPADNEFHVSELVSENPGAMSPFGEDIEFPLPVERLRYTHPSAADRPNLAGS